MCKPCVGEVCYRVHRVRPRAVELARFLPPMTGLFVQAVAHLDRGERAAILPLRGEVKRLESEADTVFRAAMSELFEEEANPAEILKWREIYTDLEDAADRAAQLATVFEGVVLKHR